MLRKKKLPIHSLCSPLGYETQECEEGGGEVNREDLGCPYEAALLDLIWTVIPLICNVIVSNGGVSKETSERVKLLESESTMFSFCLPVETRLQMRKKG